MRTFVENPLCIVWFGSFAYAIYALQGCVDNCNEIANRVNPYMFVPFHDHVDLLARLGFAISHAGYITVACFIIGLAIYGAYIARRTFYETVPMMCILSIFGTGLLWLFLQDAVYIWFSSTFAVYFIVSVCMGIRKFTFCEDHMISDFKSQKNDFRDCECLSQKCVAPVTERT